MKNVELMVENVEILLDNFALFLLNHWLFKVVMISLALFLFCYEINRHRNTGFKKCSIKKYFSNYYKFKNKGLEYVNLDNERKGILGEKEVSKELKKHKYKNSYLFNDVYLKENNEIVAQIDHILVSERGIYVIETKNWTGVVENLGTDAILYNKGKSYRTYSPVAQNSNHKKKLERVIGSEHIKDVVIFPKVKTIKDKENKMCNIKDFYKRYYKDAEVVLSKNEMMYFVDLISNIMSRSSKEKKNYIKKVKKLKSS